VAFAGLWTQSDRRGYFRWRPRELKLDILPYDNVDFADVLGALKAAGFVEHFVVDGKDYGKIPSFGQWQTFHPNERPSDVPEPNNGCLEPAKLGSNHSVTVTSTVTDSIAVTDDQHGEADRVSNAVPVSGLSAIVSQFVARFYGNAPDKRRDEVITQLRAAIEPGGAGARLSKNVRVKARDLAHLDRVCDDVLRDPPDKPDAAVVWVLRKLGDLVLDSKGRAPSEAKAEDDARRRKVEEAYFADKRKAALEWADAHAEEFKPIERRSRSQFPSGKFGEIARKAWIVDQISPHIAFPTFEQWLEHRKAS
jgi:hypothetical protein